MISITKNSYGHNHYFGCRMNFTLISCDREKRSGMSYKNNGTFETLKCVFRGTSRAWHTYSFSYKRLLSTLQFISSSYFLLNLTLFFTYVIYSSPTGNYKQNGQKVYVINCIYIYKIIGFDINIFQKHFTDLHLMFFWSSEIVCFWLRGFLVRKNYIFINPQSWRVL